MQIALEICKQFFSQRIPNQSKLKLGLFIFVLDVVSRMSVVKWRAPSKAAVIEKLTSLNIKILITRASRMRYGRSVPVVIRCIEGRIKQLNNHLRNTFGNKKQTKPTVREMQMIVLWECASIIRKVLSGLLKDRRNGTNTLLTNFGGRRLIQ